MRRARSWAGSEGQALRFSQVSIWGGKKKKTKLKKKKRKKIPKSTWELLYRQAEQTLKA